MDPEVRSLVEIDVSAEIQDGKIEQEVISLIQEHGSAKWFGYWSEAINGNRTMPDVLEQILAELLD
jgi:hypothetical protein